MYTCQKACIHHTKPPPRQVINHLYKTMLIYPCFHSFQMQDAAVVLSGLPTYRYTAALSRQAGSPRACLEDPHWKEKDIWSKNPFEGICLLFKLVRIWCLTTTVIHSSNGNDSLRIQTFPLSRNHQSHPGVRRCCCCGGLVSPSTRRSFGPRLGTSWWRFAKRWGNKRWCFTCTLTFFDVPLVSGND